MEAVDGSSVVGLVRFCAVPPFADAPLPPTSSPLGSVYKKTASWQRDTFHISRTVRRTDGQTSLLLHNCDQVSCRSADKLYVLFDSTLVLLYVPVQLKE